MASVGNVRIGSKNIEIQAFTGEVMDTAHTTYVETVRNHTTGKIGWFTPTRNKLAGPPMNQFLIIVAVFAGVFSVMSLIGAFGSLGPATFVWLVISALIFWRVQRRRKALMTAVSTALTAVRMEA